MVYSSCRFKRLRVALSKLFLMAMTVSPKGGDYTVTFESLTCIFTFGLLVVAIIALNSGNKQ